MKKLLLALMLLATPARASILVIDYTQAIDYAGSNYGGAIQTQHVALGMMDRQPPIGGYTVVPWTATKTLWVRQAQQVLSSGAVVQYDAVLHVNWKPGLSASGYNPDSMFRGSTTAATWPTKPQIFVGTCSTPFGKLTQTSACSTGVTDNGPAPAIPGLAYAVYAPNVDRLYRQSVNHLHYANPASRPAGIWRALLGYKYAPNVVAAGSDLDAVTRSVYPDSFISFVRQRGEGDAAALIVCDIGQSVGAVDPFVLKHSLAFAESLCGNRGLVIGRAPLRAAVIVSGYCRTDVTTFLGSAAGAGPFMPASGTQDLNNQLATADSMNALGIPFSGTVQTDSVTNFTDQLEIIRRMKRMKLTPQNWGGVTRSYTSDWNGVGGTRGASLGQNASKYRLNDVWGISRARRMGPISLPCADADTCVRCMVQWGVERADSLAKALGLPGVDRVLWPPMMDWTASGITRANASLLDSLAFYAWAGGARGFIGTGLVLDNNQSIYSAAAAQPLGWGYVGEVPVWTTPSSGIQAARLKILSSRGDETRPGDAYSAVHDQLNEFDAGWLVGGPWYMGHAALYNGGTGPGPLYHHDFYTACDVMVTTAQALGGVGDGSTPKRHGYWFIKGLVAQRDLLNAFGRDKPGLEVAQIVYPEELLK